MQHRYLVVYGCVCVPNCITYFSLNFRITVMLTKEWKPWVIHLIFWGGTDSSRFFVTSGVSLEFLLKNLFAFQWYFTEVTKGDEIEVLSGSQYSGS